MVSARKTKARLDNKKLAELQGKNLEKQKELSLSADEARALSDELVKSTISGFEKELSKSSPAVKKLATDLSGMMKEFFIGFKQGVDAELNTFIKDTSKTLSKATDSLVESTVTTKQETLELLKEAAQPQREKLDSNLAIADVLSRKEDGADGASKKVLGKTGNLKDWLTRAGLGTIGMEGTAEKVIAERQKKEAFVKTETKLRADEFKGMDPEEVRAKLETDFKTISETTKKLKDIEEEISAYKDLGYSEEQIKTLGVGAEKENLSKTLIAADPSRLGKYKGTELPVTVAPGAISAGEAPTAPVSEETMMEQAELEKEAAKQRDNQTTLLSEIRDILKNGGSTDKAADAGGDGGISLPDLPSLPKFRLPNLGGLAKGVAKGAGSLARSAGNLLKSGVQMANAPLGGIAKIAAPLAAGMEVGEGVMDLAEGKKVEEIGQVVPEGWSKLNPFSWAMRGGMYAGEKLNQGYGAVSEKVGGSGSLGGDIFSGVEKVKGFFGGLPTIEDVKTSASNLADTGMNAVFGTKAERVARQTDRAMLEAPGAITDKIGLKELADETKRDKYIETWKKDGGYNKLSEKEKTDFDNMVTEDFSLENSKKKLSELEKTKLEISENQSKGNSAYGFVSGIQDTKNLSEEDKKKALGAVESQYTGLERGDFTDASKRIFGTLAGKAKNLFGMGVAPTLESTNVTSNTAVPTTPTNLEKTSDKSWSTAPSTVASTTSSRGAASGDMAPGDWKRMAGNKNPDGSPMTVDQINAAKAAHRVGNMSSTGENYLQEAAIAKENGVSKPLPTSVKEATPDASAKQTAAEIGKNIVIQPPAPVVVNSGGGGQSQTVAPPFTNNTRNRDPSVSDYLKSRYAF